MAHTLLIRLGGKGRRPERTLGLAAVSLALIFGTLSSVQAQPGSIYSLPAGTRIRLRLDAELSSRSASVNDTFLAYVASPVSVRESVVLPVGTVVEGRVVGVRRPRYGGKSGRLDVTFETLRIEQRTRRIEGFLVGPAAPERSAFSPLPVVAGSAAGGAVGALTAGPKGAAIGAAAGAVIGSLASLVKKGPEAVIERDEVFEIELRSSVTLPVTDY